MIYVVLLVAFVIAIMIARGKHPWEFRLLVFFLGGAASFVVLLSVISILISKFAPREKVQVDNLRLIEVNDTSAIAGSFWIGSGRIGQVSHYYFYYQQDDGGIKQGHAPASRTVIFEDVDFSNEGRLLVFGTRLVDPWHNWAFLDNPPPHRYEMRVPPGTVIRQLELDLQ